jgi:hypothetical protein
MLPREALLERLEVRLRDGAVATCALTPWTSRRVRANWRRHQTRSANTITCLLEMHWWNARSAQAASYER